MLKKYAQLANTLGTHRCSGSHPCVPFLPHTSSLCRCMYLLAYFPDGVATWQSLVSEMEVEIVNDVMKSQFCFVLFFSWQKPTPPLFFLFETGFPFSPSWPVKLRVILLLPPLHAGITDITATLDGNGNPPNPFLVPSAYILHMMTNYSNILETSGKGQAI